METPRPTLSLTLSPTPHRSNVWAAHIARLVDRSPEDAHLIASILARHRRRQTRRLHERDEDPDPYAPSYIFFCLDGRRET
jgi:hypothetical protein